MLAAAAQRCGYRVHVLAPEERPPAAVFADSHTAAAYDDVAAVTAFAAAVDVMTFEFENVSSAALAAAGSLTTVRPSPTVLHVTQDRSREKDFLVRSGLPVAPFRLVSDARSLPDAVAAIGTPCIVKTAGFGYDGKGQVVLAGAGSAAAWTAAVALAEAGPVVVEKRIDLALELSVVAARTPAGATATFAPLVNKHVDQVLDLSFTPELVDASAAAGEGAMTAVAGAGTRLSRAVSERALELSTRIMTALDVIGLCCVEFFLSRDGELLVNEVAPRPHNSGHLTLEAAATDQFEQQLRAVCGLPLGSTRLLSPAAMVNLLGDLWQTGEPDFGAALTQAGVTLHLYGKSEARPGRKMGHLTATAPDAAAAVAAVTAARGAMTLRTSETQSSPLRNPLR